MTRLVAPLVAATLLLAPTAHAASRPQLNDPKGDWRDAAQDVLWGRLSSVRGDDGPEVQGELKLAAPPSVGGTIYRFAFTIGGCHEYSFAYEVPASEDSQLGAPNQPAMNYYDRCSGLPGSEADYRAHIEVKGDLLVWRAPYVGHLARGAIVRKFEGLACLTLTCGLGVTQTGDTAEAAGYYVLGSDLPRR
ncbi:MAG TPA: hypothetical protein VGX28_14055 [Frankiaceae bacterium]|jgi:hypothetical protein|nr:hypothetical protein [Frankiaceae bacterium]